MAALTVQQIQTLFGQEAEARLTRLNQLLLELEGAAQDEGLIRSVFREFHSLKGSSAVAGLDEVSLLAHELEGLVEDLRCGRRQVTPDVIDRLLAGVDRLGVVIAGSSGDGGDVGTVPPRVVITEAAPHREAHSTVGVTSPQRGGPARSLIPATPPVPTRHPPLGTPRADATDAAAGGAVMVQMERLDELVGLLGEAAAAHLRVGRMLKDRFGVDPASCAEFNELSRSVNVLQDRVMRTRMVPVGTITDQLHRAVRDIARAQGKDIRWQVEGSDTEMDRGVLNQLSDSLLHLVRNAVDHGIESPDERAGSKAAQGTIRLHARQLGSEVIIAVSDDGRGINTQLVRERATRLGIDTADLSGDETLQLIFRSGLSTTAFVTDVSGRGVGLDVVKTNIEAARGRIEIHSELGSGTEFRIVVPITLAVLRCLVVEAGGHRFALPFHRVVLSQAHDPSRVTEADGRAMVWVDDQPVTVSTLVHTLGISDNGPSVGPIVVLTDTARRHAFQVDRLVGQRDVVLKGLSRLLPHLPAVAGASIEPDGSIFVVLDPPGLIGRARQLKRAIVPPPRPDSRHGPRRRILVVDDALTVRELQRSILQRAGFDVRVAIDGLQALSKLADEPVDLVLTDIEMPNMDGFALTTAIRAHSTLSNIPVLILSSRSSEADRQRGLDVGADGYIIKSGFDESDLLAAVNRLLGATA